MVEEIGVGNKIGEGFKQFGNGAWFDNGKCVVYFSGEGVVNFGEFIAEVVDKQVVGINIGIVNVTAGFGQVVERIDVFVQIS